MEMSHYPARSGLYPAEIYLLLGILIIVLYILVEYTYYNTIVLQVVYLYTIYILYIRVTPSRVDTQDYIIGVPYYM